MVPESLIAFCEALAETPLSLFIQGIEWIIPLVQTIHILAIAVVMGSVGLIDLRLLGLAGRSQSIVSMAGRLLPAVWIALGVLACSGAILAIGEPLRSLANPAFHLKMLLLLVVVSLTLFLQRSLRTDPTFWELSPARRLTARLTAVVSLLLWVAIIVAGRWIAYLEMVF
jgi:hypothetical protein